VESSAHPGPRWEVLTPEQDSAVEAALTAVVEASEHWDEELEAGSFIAAVVVEELEEPDLLGEEWRLGYQGLNAGKSIDYILNSLDELSLLVLSTDADGEEDAQAKVLDAIEAAENEGSGRRTVLKAIRTLREGD